MSGAVPRTLDSGATPSPLLAPTGISCWPSGTPPSGARFRRSTHNNKTADPVHGSAVIAATRGCLPSRTSESINIRALARKKRLSGSAAPRVRQYEAGPATRRTRARCEGALGNDRRAMHDSSVRRNHHIAADRCRWRDVRAWINLWEPAEVKKEHLVWPSRRTHKIIWPSQVARNHVQFSRGS